MVKIELKNIVAQAKVNAWADDLQHIGTLKMLLDSNRSMRGRMILTFIS